VVLGGVGGIFYPSLSMQWVPIWSCHSVGLQWVNGNHTFSMTCMLVRGKRSLIIMIKVERWSQSNAREMK